MSVTGITSRYKLVTRKGGTGLKPGKPLIVSRTVLGIDKGGHHEAGGNRERNPILGIGAAKLGKAGDGATDRIQSGHQRQCSRSSLIIGQVTRKGFIVNRGFGWRGGDEQRTDGRGE